MKRRLYLILLLAAVSVCSMAQNVGDIMYIFRNDGEFHAFISEEVESMEYSYEDADGHVYDEVLTQVITTPDSVYKIPLAAIDSISFVRPETIYREGVTVIAEKLMDYVIAVDGNVLTLSPSTPSSIIPKVGDKLVAFELSEKLPMGFLGKVLTIENNSTGIVLQCEYLKPEDVAKRFYGIYKMLSENNSGREAMRKAQQKSDIELGTFKLNPITMPLELSYAFFKKADVLAFNGKAGCELTITPDVDVTLSVVHDDFLLLSNMSFHVVTDFSTVEELELVGEMDLEKKWELFTFPVKFPIGIEFYFSGGFKISGNGQLALGATCTQQGRHFMDITYYPYNPMLSRVQQNLDIRDMDIDWHYLAGRITNKIAGYVEIGFGLLAHDILKVGGEFDLGLSSKTEFMFNWDEIAEASQNTKLYEVINNTNSVDANVYFGAYFVVGAAHDLLKFKIGKDWELPWQVYKGRVMPSFDETYATWTSLNSARAYASITNDCLLPWKVGFTLHDSQDNFVADYYHPSLYWTRLASFNEFDYTFTDLKMGKDYKLYPTIDFFGHKILAEPIAELVSEHTVSTVAATNIDETTATINGKLGNYSPDMPGSVFFRYGTDNNPKANGTLVNVGDVSSLSNEYFSTSVSNLQPGTTYYYLAGYSDGQSVIYGDVMIFKTVDPNSVITLGATNITKTEATLAGYYESTDTSPEYGMIYGTSNELTYTSGERIVANSSSSGHYDIHLSNLTEETTYYYRAYLKCNAKLYYGDIRSFKTRAEAINPCPDGNHPHAIDLGLSKKTKWSCCNVGASHPFDEGGLYAWGETSEKDEYTRDTYNSPYKYGQWGNLAANNDAATVNMGGDWYTPDFEQILELTRKCSCKLVNEKGQEVDRDPRYVKVTGPNGNSIILPIGYYWSSQEIWSQDDNYWDRDGYLLRAFTLSVGSDFYPPDYSTAKIEGHNHNYNDTRKFNGNHVRAVCQ